MTPQERAKEAAMREARLAAEEKYEQEKKERWQGLAFLILIVGGIVWAAYSYLHETPEEKASREAEEAVREEWYNRELQKVRQSREPGAAAGKQPDSTSDLVVTAINKIYASRSSNISVSRQGATLVVYYPDMISEVRSLLSAGLPGTVCSALVSMLNDATPIIQSAGFSHVKLSGVDHRCSL